MPLQRCQGRDWVEWMRHNAMGKRVSEMAGCPVSDATMGEPGMKEATHKEGGSEGRARSLANIATYATKGIGQEGGGRKEAARSLCGYCGYLYIVNPPRLPQRQTSKVE